MNLVPTIVLASTSPRRRMLLSRLKVPFEILVADVDERPLPGENPVELAKRVAQAKAEAVASAGHRGIVLAADTVVALDGAILGKPRDEKDAYRMLRSLRGRSHSVITAIALLNRETGRTHVTAVTTKVWMRPYFEDEIAAYIASGDPYDKAGAYAIQSDRLRPVARIEGCYFNVVGLPLCEVVRGLIEVGFPSHQLPLDELDRICPHNVVDSGSLQ